MMILGIVWWLILLDLIYLAGLGYLVYHLWPGRSTLWAVVLGVAFAYLGGFHVFEWVVGNFGYAFFYTLGYLVIGLAWALIHWTIWVNSADQRAWVKSNYDRWHRANATTNIPVSPAPLVFTQTPATDSLPAEDIEAFRTSEYYPYGYDKDFPRILTWVLYWPLDIVLYAASEFLWDFANMVGHWFAGIFAGIAASVVKSTLGK